MIKIFLHIMYKLEEIVNKIDFLSIVIRIILCKMSAFFRQHFVLSLLATVQENALEIKTLISMHIL